MLTARQPTRKKGKKEVLEKYLLSAKHQYKPHRPTYPSDTGLGFFQLYKGTSAIKNTMKRHVNITLEPKVLETVDRERGLIKRSTFLENLIKERFNLK